MNEAHSCGELTLWCLGEQEGARKCRVGQTFFKKAPNYVITQNELFILMTPCHPEEVKCGIFHKVRKVC